MNNDLLSSLLLTHIIGDFYLQTDYFCKQKETKKNKMLVSLCAFYYYGIDSLVIDTIY